MIFKKNSAKDFFILFALFSVVYVSLEKLILVCGILIEEYEFYELMPFIGYFRIAYVFIVLALMEKICRKIKPNVKGGLSGHVKLEYAFLGLLLVFIKAFVTVRMIYALIDRPNMSFITFRHIEIVEFLDMGYGYFYLPRASSYEFDSFTSIYQFFYENKDSLWRFLSGVQEASGGVDHKIFILLYFICLLLSS